jgi:hypothetical protein
VTSIRTGASFSPGLTKIEKKQTDNGEKHQKKDSSSTKWILGVLSIPCPQAITEAGTVLAATAKART